MYYLIFKSRTHTLNFFRLLSNYGVKANIINAPASVSSICNICISFLPQDFEKVKKMLASRNISTFIGIYKYDLVNRNRVLKKIF
ncbi:MAG TPA: DUF3343 domain-containing protein [Clostridia bacterium]